MPNGMMATVALAMVLLSIAPAQVAATGTVADITIGLGNTLPPEYVYCTGDLCINISLTTATITVAGTYLHYEWDLINRVNATITYKAVLTIGAAFPISTTDFTVVYYQWYREPDTLIQLNGRIVSTNPIDHPINVMDGWQNAQEDFYITFNRVGSYNLTLSLIDA